MYTIDFSKPTSVHFIGIGGISMSGLAEILLKEGFRVSGSDSKESPLTQHLTELGAQIAYPQAAANIPDETRIIVYIGCHPSGQSGICPRQGIRPTYADTRTVGLTDHGSLCSFNRRCRNSRQDDNNLYDHIRCSCADRKILPSLSVVF